MAGNLDLRSELVEKAKQLESRWPEAFIAVYDLSGVCKYASENHANEGWTREDMLGSHWTKFVIKDDHSHGFLALQDALLNGESIEVQLLGLSKTGEQVLMRCRGWRHIDSADDKPYWFIRTFLVDPKESRTE
jgi:hypothetical protein